MAARSTDGASRNGRNSGGARLLNTPGTSLRTSSTRGASCSRSPMRTRWRGDTPRRLPPRDGVHGTPSDGRRLWATEDALRAIPGPATPRHRTNFLLPACPQRAIGLEVTHTTRSSLRPGRHWAGRGGARRGGAGRGGASRQGRRRGTQKSGERFRPGIALRDQGVRISEMPVQLAPEPFHDGGFGGGQIVLLADVGLQVVQLAVLVLEEADRRSPSPSSPCSRDRTGPP